MWRYKLSKYSSYIQHFDLNILWKKFRLGDRGIVGMIKGILGNKNEKM